MLPMVTAPYSSRSVHAPSHSRSCGQTRPVIFFRQTVFGFFGLGKLFFYRRYFFQFLFSSGFFFFTFRFILTFFFVFIF
ncbi:hypothetical protein SEEA0100_18255 [Salmonella enterica subsp. enterica serovar Anatum str. USDA 100]|nr:hypothetical protein SEEA0100_18255 [Salmonella enterica subsp. enterica serovar Anatum str. USDA 100]